MHPYANGLPNATNSDDKPHHAAHTTSAHTTIYPTPDQTAQSTDDEDQLTELTQTDER